MTGKRKHYCGPGQYTWKTGIANNKVCKRHDDSYEQLSKEGRWPYVRFNKADWQAMKDWDNSPKGLAMKAAFGAKALATGAVGAWDWDDLPSNVIKKMPGKKKFGPHLPTWMKKKLAKKFGYKSKSKSASKSAKRANRKRKARKQKKSFRAKPVSLKYNVGIRRHSAMNTLGLFAGSNLKVFGVCQIPCRVVNLRNMQAATVTNPAGADTTGAYNLFSGTTTAYYTGSNQSCKFKFIREAYELRNNGGNDCVVRMYLCKARKTCSGSDSIYYATTQNPFVSYLYEGWKNTLTSSYYSAAAVDPIGVAPATSPTSYANATVAYCVPNITLFMSQQFCRYFKVVRTWEKHLAAGSPVYRFKVNHGSRVYNPQTHFAAAESTSTPWLNKGDMFVMFALRGTPGFTLATADAEDIDMTGGTSLTTGAVNISEAKVSIIGSIQYAIQPLDSSQGLNLTVLSSLSQTAAVGTIGQMERSLAETKDDP